MDALFNFFDPIGSAESALSGFEKEFATLRTKSFPSASAEDFKKLIDKVSKYE